VKTLAYLTTDEVNEATVVRMASAYGALVVPFYPKEASRSAQFDAVLYDLDCLPTERGRKLLGDLLSAPTEKLVALHSFNVDEGLRHDLQQKGINVFRSLKSDWLRNLVTEQSPALRIGRALGL
jgi:hypothetical protein